MNGLTAAAVLGLLAGATSMAALAQSAAPDPAPAPGASAPSSSAQSAPTGQKPDQGAPAGQKPDQAGPAQPRLSPEERAKQQEALEKAMLAYMGTPEYVSLLQQGLIASESRQSKSCDDVAGTKRLGVALLEPVTFEGAKPARGAWWDKMEAKRCGKTAVYNILVTHRPGEGSRSGPLLMGSTKADPILQRDAEDVAGNTAATAPAKNKCAAFKIDDTKFEAPEKAAANAPATAPRAWTELWTLRGCGRTVNVRMRFEPTPRGTAISAALPPPPAPAKR